MNQCVKITLFGDCGNGFLREVVQKFARRHSLEGVAQRVEDNKAKILVCGNSLEVDKFVDQLHKNNLDDIEMEPFLKEKDYRRIFRVVE